MAGRKKKDQSPIAPEIQAAEIVIKAQEQGTLQFKDAEEFLMAVINNAKAGLKDRITCASLLLPYQKPKLAEMSAGKKEQQAETARLRATGRFAPPSAPSNVVRMN